MIPRSVAEAVCMIWDTSGPTCGTEYMGLRLTTTEGEPTVLLQTASMYAAIEIEFESPDLQEESIDILFSAESVRDFSQSGNDDVLEFVEFAPSLQNWKDVAQALKDVGVRRNPSTISLPKHKGLALKPLMAVVGALGILHDASSPSVRVASDSHSKHVVSFFVPMSVDGVQTHIFLMPCPVENG
jgi:hypothetical protein